ncbi:unnamed protein product [Kuraishia capsulata CBS 1993]|uniref:Ribosomal RNA-processing protein 14/surfeit locus protein 6 C-terminal domain-containing protein n=1 Tax=Kuraishia capsulata CBS 1993 TaxID=1382522 RepID=W6MLX1_9ASCO|nr:uncharacterized protein KUCA_T00003487001 [Kuraishia capsulata CBS 1993]CDK27509.1 unnamed protein product [Kuraishia capsulata CBS 1993]
MSNSLEERLKTSSTAFDGLLSLIPAKYYFDEATQDQWKQKKKDKDEIKSIKKTKFDPEAAGSSAKDVLKSREKTAQPVVIPGSKKAAFAKQAEYSDEEEAEDGEEDVDVDMDAESESGEESHSDDSKDKSTPESDEEHLDIVFDDDGNALMETSLIEEPTPIVTLAATPTPTPTPAPTSGKRRRELSPEQQKEKSDNIARLREKLVQKISAMKEKRKAPGSGASGAATSREQILEERRRKEEIRKSLKRKKGEDEQNDDEDSSDSEKEGEEATNGVIFGNIEFKDGGRVTSDLANVRTLKKTGPANKDIKAHLKLVQAKKAKLSSLEKDEQDKLTEKSSWQKALANVQGVKVKDDERLLKKALKRQEAKKRKSEREWRERKETVENTIKAKQDRREENLRLRRENKGKPRKKQQKMKKTFKGVIKPKRAGFEGKIKRK